METLRFYGERPYRLAVIHGGPGAAGEMAPVARHLSVEYEYGVLEPHQTATSVDGQIEELHRLLEEHGDTPITLIGFSWGAWLSFLVAARYPAQIQKLILVSSGPFEDQYAGLMSQVRANCFSEEERATFATLAAALNDPGTADKDAVLGRLGELISRVDAFDPIAPTPKEADAITPRADIFQSVWHEAAALRRNGTLLALGKDIACPVVAIHGDYDPHPAEGVEKPLAATVANFRFVLLRECGHKPWIERRAKDEFYAVLTGELNYRNNTDKWND
ncbi:alpha/beta hydrolase [Chloroflexi bacterium TSY]|nr:alpha/beta hydrolase [Chloroflexi bacterium TSY]